MNYYERHLGDYAKDTGHLTILEHGVYTLLLDRYYATEQGIPADQAHRIARARTDEERAAVDSVLADFFSLKDGVWTKGRIEDEIAKAHGRMENNAGKRTAEAERQRRCRERRAELFAKLREVGVNLPYNTTTEELVTQMSRVTGVTNTLPDTATQTPDTRHQTPDKQEQKKEQGARSPNGSRLPSDWTLPDDWRCWAVTERPGLDVDKEAAKFADYWHAQAGAKARKADWQATWRNWIRNTQQKNGPLGGGPNPNYNGGLQYGRSIFDEQGRLLSPRRESVSERITRLNREAAERDERKARGGAHD